jgi:hypothetical protein
VIAIGGADRIAARSMATSMEAMPRTAAPGAPPQATTDRLTRSPGTPAASKRRT